MSHTYASNLVHCVFSTAGRRDLIREPDRLRQYITGIARQKEIPLVATGGTCNHVHLLIALPPMMALAKVIQDIKGNSSRWLNEQKRGFAWQKGYGAFGVSESRREATIAYLLGQEEHHRKWSFEQEFLTLLKKSRITYDPKFVFG
jgi:REP element-mobilizing transposase RayT